MPPGNETAGSTKPARILIYGKGKSKKTWWVLDALRAGWNVILLDCDNGEHIKESMGLTPEELSRLFVLDITDTTALPIAATFMARFSRAGNKFQWDEQDKQPYLGLPKVGHSYVQIEAAKLPRNVILCMDSHTSLARSTLFQFAKENKISLDDAAKVEWDGYGFEGRFLDHVLIFLKALPCHVVVIGHSTVYEKRSKDGKTIISQTTQPISSSGKHAGNLSSQFSDVLFFKKLSATTVVMDSAGSDDVDAGCRLIPPKTFQFGELKLADVIAKTGDKPLGIPATQIPGFTWIAPKSAEEIAAMPIPGTMSTKVSLVSAPPTPAERTVVSAEPAAGRSAILSALLG